MDMGDALMLLKNMLRFALDAGRGPGRPRHEPNRTTEEYARLMNIGGYSFQKERPLIKPSPASLRMFAKTPYARRAINRVKDRIAALEWEIIPKNGVKLNSELQRQIDTATLCFEQPNSDDGFRTFSEKMLEDMMVGGAGPYEQQIGGQAVRPLWMWPVDVLSIQVYAGWDGGEASPRYCQTFGYGNVGGVQGIDLYNAELMYPRIDPNNDSPFSFGPLEVAFATINRKLGVSDYAGALSSNAQPENLLVFEGMSPDKVQSMRGWWRNEIEGRGITPIVGAPGPQAGGTTNGVYAVKLRGTDDKALFLEYQEMLIREVFVSFGLAPMNGGIVGDVNRNTAEVADDQDWDNAIKPKALLQQAAFTHTIQRRLGFSQLEFHYIGLEREDELNLAKVFETEYKNNAITPNEYRAARGRAPSTDAWGDMTFADMQIAVAAARGAAVVDDPDLPSGRGAGAADPAKKQKTED